LAADSCTHAQTQPRRLEARNSRLERRRPGSQTFRQHGGWRYRQAAWPGAPPTRQPDVSPARWLALQASSLAWSAADPGGQTFRQHGGWRYRQAAWPGAPPTLAARRFASTVAGATGKQPGLERRRPWRRLGWGHGAPSPLRRPEQQALEFGQRGGLPDLRRQRGVEAAQIGALRGEQFLALLPFDGSARGFHHAPRDL
jgi:hypothetical protein